LTLADLSERTHIAVATLNRWELGQIGNPKPSSLLTVAAAIKLSPPDTIFAWLEENNGLLCEKAIAQSLDRGRTLPDDRHSNESSVLRAVVDLLAQKPGVARFAYFGAKLMRARRRAGFTLKELSDRVNITPQALNKWELGLVENPNPSHMLNVARAIGLDPIDQIFDWMEDNKQILREVAVERSLSGVTPPKETKSTTAGVKNAKRRPASIRKVSPGAFEPNG